MKEFEVLAGKGFTWGNTLDANAVCAGSTLFIGRARHHNSDQPGTIFTHPGQFYIAFDGKAVKLPKCEILIAPKPAAHWVAATASSIPQNAVRGGVDKEGSDIYVGRATMGNSLVPGKVIPSKKIAYFGYNGSEVAKTEFEVLCGGNVVWVPCSGGNVPQSAVHGGHTGTGETLFIGRAHWQGSLTVGRFHRFQGLYIPFGGDEVSIKTNYEVLIEV